MGVKIKQRQFKAFLEEGINGRRYLDEWEPFWRQTLEDDELWQQSDKEPVRLTTPWGISIWLYKNVRFEVRGYAGCSDTDLKLFIRDAFDKEETKIERLRKRYAARNSNS